jgi:beta-glucosidase/6-phospho-beta-glucosidase/beta-galactosidase
MNYDLSKFEKYANYILREFEKYVNYVLREFQENILLLLKYKSSSSNTLQHLPMKKKNDQKCIVLQKL